MIEIRTRDGRMVGRLKLTGRTLTGSTPAAQEVAALAARLHGDGKTAYRALMDTSTGWADFSGV